MCRAYSLISSNPLSKYHLLTEAGLDPYFKWHPCSPLHVQSLLLYFFFFPHSTDHPWTYYVIFLLISFIIYCLLFLCQVLWSQNLHCFWSVIYPKCIRRGWHMLGIICWISRWLFYAQYQCPNHRKAEPLWMKQRKQAKTPGYTEPTSFSAMFSLIFLNIIKVILIFCCGGASPLHAGFL